MTETEYRLNHTTDNEDDDLTVTLTVTLTVSLSVSQPGTTVVVVQNHIIVLKLVEVLKHSKQLNTAWKLVF